MNLPSICFLIFLGCYEIYLQLILYASEHGPLFSNVAIGVMRIVLTMVFLHLCAHYCNEWGRINKRSILLTIFRLLIVPYVLLFWATKYSLVPIHQSVILSIFSALICICWLFLHQNIIKNIVSNFKIKDRDKKLFFACYPPKSRSDMFVFDVMMVLLLTAPLFMPVDIGY